MRPTPTTQAASRLASTVARYKADKALASEVLEDIKVLRLAFEESSAEVAAVLAPLLPYVLFPVQAVLGTRRSETPPPPDVTEAALLCVAAVVRACGPRFASGAGPAVVFGLVTRAAAVLGDQPAPPEHVLLACAVFLEALFSAASEKPATAAATGQYPEDSQAWEEFRASLQGTLNGALVAQLAHGLLGLASSTSGGRKLQLRSLAALRYLMLTTPDRTLWLRFLPGTFSALARLAAPPSRAAPAAAVAASALDAAVVIVVLSLSEGSGRKASSDGPPPAVDSAEALRSMAARAAAATSPTTNLNGGAARELSSVKPPATVAAPAPAAAPLAGGDESSSAAARLCEALPPLLARCRLHSGWRVRFAAVSAAGELLRCLGDGPLKPCRADLLEGAAASLWDNMPDVAAAAASALADSGGGMDTRSAAARRALKHVDALGSLARTGEEARLRDGLDVLSGCLWLAAGGGSSGGGAANALAGSGRSAILEASLQRALSSLSEVLSPDSVALSAPCIALETIAEAAAAGRPREALFVRHSLLHVREEATLAAVRRAVRLLAAISDPWAMLDALCGAEGLAAPQPSLKDHKRQLLPRAVAAWTESRLPLAALLAELAISWSGTAENDALAEVQRKTSPPAGLAEEAALRILRSDAWTTTTATDPPLGSIGAKGGFYLQEEAPRHVAAALAASLCEALGALAGVAAAAGEAPLFLLRALFPLLECAADPRLPVHSAALAALRLAARKLHYEDLPALLAGNMDYIVDAASRRMAESTGVAAARLAAVVEAVLTHGGSETAKTPLAHDLCCAALKMADASWWDDSEGAASAAASLGVLRAVVRCLRMPESSWKGELASGAAAAAAEEHESDVWFAQLLEDFGDLRPESAEALSASEKDLEDKVEIAGGGGATAFAEQARRWEAARKQAGDTIASNEREAEEQQRQREDERKRLSDSPEVSMVREVLVRVAYLLAAPSPKVQAAAAAATCECLERLASVGVDTVLLPAVHKLWPSLAARLRDHRKLASKGGGHGAAILARVLETSAFVVGLCGDFCSTKVEDDLWPAIKHLLADGSKSGWGRHSASRAALLCLEALAAAKACRGIIRPLSGEAAGLVLPALGDAGAGELAESVLRLLARLDSDSVWLLVARAAGGDKAAPAVATAAGELALFSVAAGTPPLPGLPSWQSSQQQLPVKVAAAIKPGQAAAVQEGARRLLQVMEAAERACV